MPTDTASDKTNKILESIDRTLKAGMTPADQKAAAEAQKAAAEALKKAAEDKKRKKDPQKAAEEAAGKDDKQKKETHQQMMGLFATIKSDVTKWALDTDKNNITWGGLGKAIKESVKNWFKEVAKTNTLLGRTFRVGAALWNNVFKKIGENFKRVFNAVTSQIREVLGPVAALYDVMINTLKGVWESTKSVFGALFEGFKKVPPADKKRNQLLRGMLSEMIVARKGKFVEGLGEKKKGGLFGKMGGMMGWIIPVALFVVKLFMGLWMIYKFVQGFMGSDADTISGKFKDGIFNLFWTIIKWPVKMLEWVLGKLGFASEGLTEKVEGWVRTFVDFIGDFHPLKPFMDFFDGYFGTEGTFWQKVGAGFENVSIQAMKTVAKWGPKLANVIMPIIEGVLNFFTNTWNIMVNWMISKINSLPWFPFKGDIVSMLSGMSFEMATAGSAAGISDEQAKAFGAKHKLGEVPLNEIKDLMAETNARLEAGQKETALAIIGSARESGGYKTDIHVPSDEVENWGLTNNNADTTMAGNG